MSEWNIFRSKLEEVFQKDTAAPGVEYKVPSSGHSAAVAIVVNQLWGGEFKSVTIEGKSHWFNCVDGKDVDLTGDQYGIVKVNVGKNIYPGSVVRHPVDLTHETRERALLLSKRLGFDLGLFVVK